MSVFEVVRLTSCHSSPCLSLHSVTDRNCANPPVLHEKHHSNLHLPKSSGVRLRVLTEVQPVSEAYWCRRQRLIPSFPRIAQHLRSPRQYVRHKYCTTQVPVCPSGLHLYMLRTFTSFTFLGSRPAIRVVQVPNTSDLNHKTLCALPSFFGVLVSEEDLCHWAIGRFHVRIRNMTLSSDTVQMLQDTLYVA